MHYISTKHIAILWTNLLKKIEYKHIFAYHYSLGFKDQDLAQLRFLGIILVDISSSFDDLKN
jgi:hypothetical protein